MLKSEIPTRAIGDELHMVKILQVRQRLHLFNLNLQQKVLQIMKQINILY